MIKIQLISPNLSPLFLSSGLKMGKEVKSWSLIAIRFRILNQKKCNKLWPYLFAPRATKWARWTCFIRNWYSAAMWTSTIFSVWAEEIFVLLFSTYTRIVVTCSWAKCTNTVFTIELVDRLQNAFLMTHTKRTSMLSFCTVVQTVTTSWFSAYVLETVYTLKLFSRHNNGY